MFLNVEYIWWVILGLGLIAMTIFIWYFSRGTDWIDEDEDLKHLNDNEKNDTYFVDRYPFL